jgi:TRAP-type C4-dicarboxylate transport system permease small subunit
MKQKDEQVPPVLIPLRALDGALRRGEIVVLVTVLIAMIALSFAQVVLRKIRPVIPAVQEVAWFDILTRHFVLWVGILGASIAAREGRHFGVEILPKLFSERGRQRLEAVLNLAAGAVTLLLTLGMWNYVALSETKALFVIEALGVSVHRGWLLSIMPVGLGLMTYRFFLRSLEAILLTPEQWHHLERELKPDLTAAAVPSAEPASLGSGAVIEASTPPEVQVQQEQLEKALEAKAAPVQPAGRTPPAPDHKKVDKSTDEIRVRRLGDLMDVSDPPPEPARPKPSDPDVDLVDSDMTMSGPPIEDPDAAAPTERQIPPDEVGK